MSEYVIKLSVEHDVVVDNNTTAVFATTVEVILSGASALDAVHSALLLISREYGDTATSKFTTTIVEVVRQ